MPRFGTREPREHAGRVNVGHHTRCWSVCFDHAFATWRRNCWLALTLTVWILLAHDFFAPQFSGSIELVTRFQKHICGRPPAPPGACISLKSPPSTGDSPEDRPRRPTAPAPVAGDSTCTRSCLRLAERWERGRTKPQLGLAAQARIEEALRVDCERPGLQPFDECRLLLFIRKLCRRPYHTLHTRILHYHLAPLTTMDAWSHTQNLPRCPLNGPWPSPPRRTPYSVSGRVHRFLPQRDSVRRLARRCDASALDTISISRTRSHMRQ